MKVIIRGKELEISDEMATRFRIGQKYFIAGVAPSELFANHVISIRKILEREKKAGSGAYSFEILMMGLFAYYESYFKGQFAGLVNIIPTILKNFIKQRGDLSIKLRDIVNHPDETRIHIGSLITEYLNMGSPKEINSIFRDLLGVTLFSKSEKKVFDGYLWERSLILHHGGVYTAKHSSQNVAKKKLSGRLFLDSITYDYEMCIERLETSETHVKKIMKVTHDKIVEHIAENNILLDEEEKVALEALGKYELWV